ncbi:MAG: GC-type dockerin domain-anchored protein [Phycisphaerales bacterium]
MIHIVAPAALSVFAVAGCAIANDLAKECNQEFDHAIRDCNDTFHNPDAPNHQDQHALDTCGDGARAQLQACLAGNDTTLDAWDQFVDSLESCYTLVPQGGPLFEDCLEGKLDLYRHRLGLTPDDDCNASPIGNARVALTDSLHSAAIDQGNPDGKYKVRVETSLGFQAGVSATNSYNIGIEPCIKSARLLAIYDTKAGPVATLVDADTDTTNGTHFDFPIFSNKVIDATRITLVSVFYNQNAEPVFIEYAPLTIEESPIQGDWNRDEVLNSQDIIDFLASFDAQSNRADINEDGQVDQEDAQQYIND